MRYRNTRLIANGLQLQTVRNQMRNMSFTLVMRQQQVEEYEEVQPPDLDQLPQRWNNLKQEDQHDIIDYLKDLQEENWNVLTTREKQAAWYLAYGDWGLRDTNQLSLPEFIFKLMSTSLLFMVSGFSVITYFQIREEVEKLSDEEL